MRTIYDWPIILRGELVYFGRAVALMEGIGAREIATTVLRQLPGLLAPISSFLEPFLPDPQSPSRIAIIPRAPEERLLAAPLEAVSAT